MRAAIISSCSSQPLKVPAFLPFIDRALDPFELPEPEKREENVPAELILSGRCFRLNIVLNVRFELFREPSSSEVTHEGSTPGAAGVFGDSEEG